MLWHNARVDALVLRHAYLSLPASSGAIMSPEETQRLCDDFPELYGADFSFSCGDGWADLLYALSQVLANHAKRAGLQLVISDVKEKHGSLRFYAEGTDDESDRLIDAAEQASLTIPEAAR